MSFKEWISNNFYNDLPNLGTYALMTFFSLTILGISMFFHELGHLLYFRFKLKKKVNIYFTFISIRKFYWTAGKNEDYKDVTAKQNHQLLEWGLIFGTVPIIITTFLWFPFLFFADTLLCWCMGRY